MKAPEVSVVMSCYNSELTLRRALDSIINQTFSKFEFIIIDDGSTDGTLQIINEYVQQDNRIVLIKNNKNLGLAASLNRGILHSKGSLIARMDADDEAYKSRLEKQTSFLDQNKQVDILGSAIQERTKNGEVKKIRTLPEHHDSIIERIFRKPLVYHPTIMVRREIYEQLGLYDPKIFWAEDADLWYRLYDKVIFHNLQEPLLYYQTKEKLSFKQASYNLKIKYRNLQERQLVWGYLPQLFKDAFILSLKMIRYSL